MGIYVTFQPHTWGGSTAAPFAGNGRAAEAIADAATGSLTAQDGEVAIVINTGTAVSYVAHGTTPDSAAVAATAASSARYAIPAGAVVAFSVPPSHKFASAAS